MAKKTPRTKALETLQKLVRLKAADDNGYVQCVTCDKVGYWTEMQGGHFIPKGNCSRWALEEENLKPQCPGCNNFGMKYGDAAQRFTTYMIDYHGRDFVDHMLATKHEPVKFYKRDYEEMTREWTTQIKEHLHRIGHG